MFYLNTKLIVARHKTLSSAAGLCHPIGFKQETGAGCTKN